MFLVRSSDDVCCSFFFFLFFFLFPPPPPPLLLLLLLLLSSSSSKQDFRGDTAVHATSVNGYVACLQLLLQSGAEVDIPNRKGQLPTHMARDSDSMQTLIDHSGDVFGVDNVGRTTLFTAAANGRVTTVVCIFLFQNLVIQKKQIFFFSFFLPQACRADSTFHFFFSCTSLLSCYYTPLAPPPSRRPTFLMLMRINSC